MDECRDLATTVLAPDGTSTLDAPVPAERPGLRLLLRVPDHVGRYRSELGSGFDQSETDTVRAQVARFASVCRVFAPVYRSITLGGLICAGPEAREIAYGDVVDAWRSYVIDHNDGRGVVLIGHSQGAGHLAPPCWRRRSAPIPPRVSCSCRRCCSARRCLATASAASRRARPPTSPAASCRSRRTRRVRRRPQGARFGVVLRHRRAALCVDPAALLGGDGTVDPSSRAHAASLGWRRRLRRPHHAIRCADRCRPHLLRRGQRLRLPRRRRWLPRPATSGPSTDWSSNARTDLGPPPARCQPRPGRPHRTRRPPSRSLVDRQPAVAATAPPRPDPPAVGLPLAARRSTPRCLVD